MTKPKAKAKSSKKSPAKTKSRVQDAAKPSLDELKQIRVQLEKGKKLKPLQSRKAYDPDEEEEFEDEEFTAPLNPVRPSNPDVAYPPDNAPEMEPPPPPSPRNSDEDGGDRPPDTTLGQDATPPAHQPEGVPQTERVPISSPSELTFRVSDLMKDPELLSNSTKVQELMVNLSVMGYLTQERVADSHLKAAKALAEIHNCLEHMLQALTIALNVLLNPPVEYAEALNGESTKMPELSGGESSELLEGP
jgi:hypothetical protein